MPKAEDFRQGLKRFFEDHEKIGKEAVIVISGDLHNRVGGYSGSNHAMPTCCSVMTQEMKEGDEILDGPLSGKGATLKIRYLLPR